MSAVTWVEIEESTTGPLRWAEPARRRHLAAVPDSVRAASRDLTLTARVRAVVAGLLLFLVTLGGAMAWARLGTTGPQPVPRTGPTITIAPGQTLSEIAVTQLPALPIADAVAAIQIANDLPSTQISAGDQLVIPKF